MKTITEQLTEWGISDPHYLGDGAYMGTTETGVAVFTTDGLAITRPVFLDEYGIRMLEKRMKE